MAFPAVLLSLLCMAGPRESGVSKSGRSGSQVHVHPFLGTSPASITRIRLRTWADILQLTYFQKTGDGPRVSTQWWMERQAHWRSGSRGQVGPELETASLSQFEANRVRLG